MTDAFNRRAFVACMAVLTGISLPLSGVANHLLGFEPLSSGREAWMAAHNAMGALFAVFATWHVVLNRRALANHFRKAAAASREAGMAVALTVLVLALAVGHAFLGGAPTEPDAPAVQVHEAAQPRTAT